MYVPEYICIHNHEPADRCISNGVSHLRVGDEEGGDAAAVQLADQLVDVRVHDGLAHQRERAVRHLEGLLPPVGYFLGGRRSGLIK